LECTFTLRNVVREASHLIGTATTILMMAANKRGLMFFFFTRNKQKVLVANFYRNNPGSTDFEQKIIRFGNQVQNEFNLRFLASLASRMTDSFFEREYCLSTDKYLVVKANS
jgi:hypothetical protein